MTKPSAPSASISAPLALRGLFVATGVAALTAAVALFLPWHDVPDRYMRAVVTHTGFVHRGTTLALVTLITIVVSAAYAALSDTRRGARAAGWWTIGAGGLAAAIIYVGAFLPHILDRVVARPGQWFFVASLAATIASGIACVIVASVRRAPRLPSS